LDLENIGYYILGNDDQAAERAGAYIRFIHRPRHINMQCIDRLNFKFDVHTYRRTFEQKEINQCVVDVDVLFV
jgi:hypothetical protein